MKQTFRETYLAHIVVVRVQVDTELRQQTGPPLEAPLQGNRRDEDADGGTNEGRRVPDAVQTFCLDELCHVRRELLKVCADVVLENETTEGAGRLIWNHRHKCWINPLTLVQQG